MKSTVFKRILLHISVCTLLLLLGCGQTPPLSDSTPATTEPQPPATTEELSAEPIEQVKARLNDYLNFRLSMEYMEPMRYSTFQETDMLYAADGSYRMTNSRKNTHGTQETEETADQASAENAPADETIVPEPSEEFSQVTTPEAQADGQNSENA